MIVVQIDCDRITDWESFHAVFAETFGFPDFYGRNMNAWIDCMSYLDDLGAGMSTVSVPAGGVLTLQLDGANEFAARCPEQHAALVECSAFVNLRRMVAGEAAVLALANCKSTGTSAAESGVSEPTA
jgi:hypothetical protein